MAGNPIVPTIPLHEDGAHHGFLRLPYSRDDSAWGSVMIPITVIKNGAGPTALLTGANHGDEYEGPIALMELAVTLKPEDIEGRVIIVPAMNYPAFRAGTRTSPIDRGNMNGPIPVCRQAAGRRKRSLVLVSRPSCCRKPAFVCSDFHSVRHRRCDFIAFASAHVLAKTKEQSGGLCRGGRCEAFNRAPTR